MNLSGILVIVPPERIDAATGELNTLPGVEVYHADAASGRIVVVQEAESVDDEVAGLTRIKALSGVMFAELVYHYFEQAPPEWQTVPETLIAD